MKISVPEQTRYQCGWSRLSGGRGEQMEDSSEELNQTGKREPWLKKITFALKEMRDL